MSDLTQAGLDPNVEEARGKFHVVPAGKYPMVMVADNIAKTKSGNGLLMTIIVQIIEGPESGNIIDVRLNIKNTSDIAQRIGQGTLKRLCTLTDTPYPPPDTTRMYGKPFLGTVGVESFISNKTGEKLYSNVVTAFNPIPSTPQHQTVEPDSTSPWDTEQKPFTPSDVPF